MIPSIYADTSIQQIIRHTLSEQGMEVEIGSSLLLANGDLDTENIVILKPDDFYCTPYFAAPPKSVDGIAIVKAASGKYHFYIVELKSSRFKNIKKSDIQAKFDTIFQRFFSPDFQHIFVDMDYELETLNLWLVCDPLQMRAKCQDHEQFLEKVRIIADRLSGLLNDYAATFKPFSFKHHTAMIRPLLSPPTIELDGYVDLLA
ncbi:hypothetical protein [Pseudomonas sp. NBRC 111138]|uniref:hypothetical protein n=1 Tax=Pseudomonas sp. NBRC 111138 TaxID=1661053 RepID=UPI0006D42777|nr:hypothetical protein [Pseudomonas sp. NBRC 111138]